LSPTLEYTSIGACRQSGIRIPRGEECSTMRNQETTCPAIDGIAYKLLGGGAIFL